MGSLSVPVISHFGSAVGQTTGVPLSADDPSDHRLSGLRRRLALERIGGYLLSPDQAPAGTKRLNNLLHSSKLTEEVVEDELWQQADQKIERGREQGEDAAFDLGEQ